jgi:hypothetical protein
MGKVLIIPGVSVSVVKDVLPQQIAPSGVLGLVGFTGGAGGAQRAASWNRLRGLYGDVIALSLPEARQALDNGVSELVVVSLPEDANYQAQASLTNAAPQKLAITVRARAGGPWANTLDLVVQERAQGGAVDLAVKRRGSDEVIEQVRNIGADRLEAALAGMALIRLDGAADGLPAAGTYPLSGGKDASESEYKAALNALTEEPDVDLVLAAVQDFEDTRKVVAIYSDVISHCNNLSGEAKGRIGLGQIGPQWSVATAREAVSNLVSDRFVLIAPAGLVGAVAGLIGNLDYFASPTFKAISGTGPLARALKTEEQTELLKANVVPIATERGRGTIVVRGLTTDGDQISVRRVADRAVRTLKMTGDLFIGRLNNSDGRGALKQKLIEALLQMQRDGAIVPSPDGKDPAFKVDVYSSQEDFAKGIVRVDMAVRPIRAIDFIYATVLVQV